MPDWNTVYEEKSVETATPADVLKNNSRLLPEGSGERKVRALDYACGLAGNSVFLAKKGFQVDAWDMSEPAVAKVNAYAAQHGLQINAEVTDLENNPGNNPASNPVSNSGKFDIVVVSYYLHRPALRNLYNYLNDDGLLFYQTFSGDQLNGVGPSRKEFRLQRGELLDVFSDMQLLYYREDSYQPAYAESVSDQVFFVAKK